MSTSNALVARGLRSASELAKQNPHGTRIRYLGGCRCIDCRKANSLYSYDREVAVREGRGNCIVDATPARRHIRALGRRGVGYRTVARLSGVARSIVAGIKSGERTAARRQTIQAILAIQPRMLAASAVVPAGATWKLIHELRTEGYTMRFLAEQLGLQRTLQFGKRHVLVKTADAVRELHQRLTGDAYVADGIGRGVGS